jgi:hypothetical protein
MMSWPLIKKDSVSHIGDLETLKTERLSASHEAYCLSVSEHPEEWRAIARLGGRRIWQLQRKESLFVDVHSFTSEQKQAVASWAVAQQYARKVWLWKAWVPDENDEWSYFLCRSSEEAAQETEFYDIPPGEGPAPDGSCIESVEEIVLTEKGIAGLERWHDPQWGYDGALILFCREVIAAEDPDIVGIWWNDDYDPVNLSCPRGGIFPDRIDEFERCPAGPHTPDIGIEP